MAYQATRLDRFISAHTDIKRRDVRAVLAQGRVSVNGESACEINQSVRQFCRVIVDGQILQSNVPVYIMMNKPAGVVSATRDCAHSTVIDLLNETDRPGLHIAGRLDFNSTGLVLISNNGRWTKSLSLPERKLYKHYRVKLEQPISQATVDAFEQGMHFAYENITTRPAQLKIIDSHHADVSICEGRYHQIKRMFGHFQNPVLALHRYGVGPIRLDRELAPGQYRQLSEEEVNSCGQA
ncbi:MAG: 16S rRNA pseudouridine(516) synthase [Halioglobus sp.]